MDNTEGDGYKGLVKTDRVDSELNTLATSVERIVSEEIGNATKINYEGVVVVSGNIPGSKKKIEYKIFKMVNEPNIVSILGQHPTYTTDDRTKLRLKNIEDLFFTRLGYDRTQTLRPFMQYTPSA